MSKDGLPTLKDGELFGDVLKQPIVVRYHGVDTQTVEGAALVAARTSEVNRFVAKGRQAYSLSGRTHLAVRGQITDGDVRYTNQFGNEIVDVRVSTPRPAPKQTPLPTFPPDWWLLEIEVPDSAGYSILCQARLLRPNHTTLAESDQRYPGVSIEVDGASDVYQPMTFPVTGLIGGTVEVPTTRSSVSTLRVDLHPFRYDKPIIIQLSGGVYDYDRHPTIVSIDHYEMTNLVLSEEEIDSIDFTGHREFSFPIFDTPSEIEGMGPNGAVAYYWAIYFPGHPGPEEVPSPYITEYDENGNPITYKYPEISVVPDNDDFTSGHIRIWYSVQTLTWSPYYKQEPDRQFVPKPAILHSTFFWGKPPWEVTQFSTPGENHTHTETPPTLNYTLNTQSFISWTLPDRSELGHAFADATIPDWDHFGIFGTVICDWEHVVAAYHPA